MVMSYIWASLLGLSVLSALLTGQGSALSGAAIQGAQSGVTLAVSIAGSLCLWAGVGKLLEKLGITEMLSKLLKPVLGRVFPSTKTDAALASCLSANVCANFLGLGNAATPPGIAAAKRLAGDHRRASDELCRLVVLNTASIQLLPTNVAAVRAGLGCAAPFDILPAVWSTSVLSAGLGLCAAHLLGRAFRD